MDAPNIPGPTASELLLHMRNSGWLSLSSDFQVTGLPRHGVVPRPSPLRLRSLTAEEEASLTKIKKASHSPISLMHVEASDTSLSSILPSLVAKVAEQAPSHSPISLMHVEAS